MPGWHISSGGAGGSGDVAGPAGATDNDLVAFDGATGKLLKDTGILYTDVVVGPASATDNAFARFDGATGKLLQNGVLTSADFNGDLTGPATNTATSGLGTAFTNQPTNDGVTIVSDNAADTTQTVTIIGNTNGGDVITTEDIALNGVVPVNSVKVDWGQVVAVKLSAACAGTVTISETSGGLAITTIAPAATSAGVFATSTSAFARIVNYSSNGATTKHVGIQGTNTVGATVYEGMTLTGTTLAAGATSFVTVTELYIGDLENNRSLTVTVTGGTKLNSNYVVTGPTTAVTDNAIPRFDGTRSDLLQNSAVVIADTTGEISWGGDTGIKKVSAGIVGATNGAGAIGEFESSRLRLYDAFGGNQVMFLSGSTSSLWISNATQIAWDSGGSVTGAVDLGLARIAAGQLAVKNSSTGMANNLKIGTTTVNLAGATTTATGLFPAKCVRLGVTYRVTTIVTSGDGGTSFNVGDGVDADLYGATIAFAAGTTGNLDQATANPTVWAATAGDIVFTCVGGTFNGGVVRVCAHFLDLTAPTS